MDVEKAGTVRGGVLKDVPFGAWMAHPAIKNEFGLSNS